MLNLTKEELLVLFEFTHRICETNQVAASHAAEIVVIDKIAAELEWMPETRESDYNELLGVARRKILSEYKVRMGEWAWVEKVSLHQT